MKICLNIIMKDESKVLLRMLNSVLPLIDTYCIVDTGSTDDSKKIVKDFFDEKGITGEIHDHPFTDFEAARNYALSKLKGKADYGFWIDCDEQLILQHNFDVNKFKEELSKYDLGTTIVISGQNKFARRNLFKVSKSFRWEGKVHEILLCDEEIKIKDFIVIQVSVNSDGNSWSEGTQKKFLKHAEILQREVNKSSKPRDIFYLAQSYKDAGDYEKSIYWYRERVRRTDGFYEERYYSQLMIGILYEITKRPYQETIAEYLKCSELDTFRAEHILNSILILQREGLWQTAYLFSSDAVAKYHNNNPYPNRLLFLDEKTYSEKLMTAHNLNKNVLKKYDRINGYEINPYSNHIHFFTKLFEFKKFNSVFEYGCGLGSTPFFLDNCERVVALEMQDVGWYEKVKNELFPKYGNKLEIHCRIGKEGFDFIEKINEKFDLIFVDGHGGSRPECINKAFDLGYKYIVTHDTEDVTYGYGWDRIKVPEGYFRYDFKEYSNWTTIFTNDLSLYYFLIQWKPFDNKIVEIFNTTNN